ncbi:MULTISPECIES: EAL domain-containing protein [unclassified Thioalkalivibrio]|uniref:bifunctional diguanylate cyclase/phosphodiesterase n=1 Tax=unclassified Thioalkalivibrio TaxID=2621013 RepID=UPI00037CB050|nr:MULTISPECIES: EAL domain-containing protein [unclassified Thioalkalivibrio]
MRLNVAWQIIIGTVAIQVVMVGALLFSGITQVQQNQQEVLERTAEQQSRLLGSALTPGLAYADPAMLQDLLGLLADDSNVLYAVVLDASDRPLASVGVAPDHLPAVEQGVRREAGQVEIARSIELSDQPLGSVAVGYSTEAIEQLSANLLERNVLLALGVLGLSILAAILFALMMTRRLRLLLQGSKALEAGHLDHRVRIDSRDEFGDLALTFNDMAAHLGTTQSTLQQQNQQLNRSVARLESMLGGANAILWEANPDSHEWEFVAGDTRKLLGFPSRNLGRGELRARHIHPADLPRVREAAREPGAGPKVVDYRFAHRNGQWIWLRDILSWADDSGNRRSLRGLTLDITAHRRATAALKESENRYKDVVNHISEVIFRTDADGRWTLLNPAWEAMTGFPVEETLGEPLCNYVVPHDRDDAQSFCATLLEGGTHAQSEEIRLRTHDGGHRWVSVYASARFDDDGQVMAMFGTMMDISDRKEAEEEIRRLAFFDGLTGLPNRTLLHDRLGQALANTARTGQHGAVLFIDLDNFKDINDTLGHAVGDDLLRQVARRMANSVREADTLARLGGDEFVIILNDLHPDPARAATEAEAVGRKLINLLREPFELAGQNRHVTPSIGATLFSGRSLGVEEVLKQADLAMYRAKNAGRNTVRFYDPELHRAVEARFELESELRQALDHDGFTVAYQPQVEADGHVIGAELLLRWPHPQRGEIAPTVFIPVAEQTGLIVPIGRQVLRTACERLAAWQHSAAFRKLTLSVNVSARQFRHKQFVQDLHTMLQETGAPASRLKLELTESMLLEDVDTVVSHIDDLRLLGVEFALDDFGTGYSSLAYLKRLPLSQLKIDQSFVRDVLDDPNDAAIAQMVVNLAHTLDLDVIAEGVETDEQRAFLFGLGCRHFQGFLYGYPGDLEGLETAVLAASPVSLEPTLRPQIDSIKSNR